MSVEHLDEETARTTIAAIEVDYPDFPAIFENTEIAQCCKVDAVSWRYGWGDATDAWSEYDSLRWILGDR